jgi:SAM-dependent methyltransferase
LFAEAVGIDADADMVRVAARGAAKNERFVQLRAETLPAGLGTFDVITLAQSFHWFAHDEVAETLHGMLAPDGTLVFVGATTHEGDGNVPRAEIAALVVRWLGRDKRAGQGFRGFREDPKDVLARTRLRNRRDIEVERDETIDRSEDAIVASVFSQSYSAPHLFGERVGEFEAELRALLHGCGPFYEQPRSITLSLWDA